MRFHHVPPILVVLFAVWCAASLAVGLLEQAIAP